MVPSRRIPCVAAAAFSLAATLLSGCAVAVGAAAGAGTAAYLSNQSTRDLKAPLRTVYDAALAALPALGYPAPATARLGPTEGRIEAGDAVVALAQHPGGVVRVAVKVGTFASPDHARRAGLLLERIAAGVGGA